MHNAAYRLKGMVDSWWADTVLAAGLAVGMVAYLAAQGTLDEDWAIPILVVVCCGAIAGRRRWSFGAAVATSAAFFLVRASGQAHAFHGPVVLFLWTALLVTYLLGTTSGLAPGLAGVVLIAAGLQVVTQTFNPFFGMITFGPWLAGRVVLSRRRLGRRIESRNKELEAGRALFAQESVRYERARIARELHDIVAHCVSVMVVQAGAGQRLAASDPTSAGEVFDAIGEAALEAQTEIGLLVELLNGANTPDHCAGLQMIDELVGRVSATGLDVRYRLYSDGEALSQAASDAAYRIVQESLTNAIKHAPGAPIDITIRQTANQIDVEVMNAPCRASISGLAHSGGGRGLAGMSERVAACGGAFTACRTAAGGWRVAAFLPGDRPHPPQGK